MALATEGGSFWEPLDLGGALDPLESVLELDGCLQPCDCSLLAGQDPLLADTSPEWLASDLAAGHAGRAVAVGESSCQPRHNGDLLPSLLHNEHPQTPAEGSFGLAAAPVNSGSDDLAAAASLIAASWETNGLHLLDDAQRRQPVHGSLRRQQQQQQQHLQQPLDAGTRQPKPRGRPRADRSQMTEKQLKAIRITEAHHARKKNHLRDLEERVADVKAELERERARQEEGQQALAALERLLNYSEEMAGILRQHGQAGGGSWRLGAPDVPPHQVPTFNSRDLRLAAACPHQAGLLLGADCSAEQLSPERLAQEADAFAAAAYCRTLDQHLRIPGLFPRQQLAPASGLLVATWAQKLPRTWRFIEAVMRGQVPSLLPGQRGAVAAGIQVSIQLQLERWRRHHEARQQQPNTCQLSYHDMHETPQMATVWAAAGPAVVDELRSFNPGDFAQGWLDCARVAREALAEYDATQDEEQALGQLQPVHWLGGVMRLAVLHNPLCLDHLFITTAEKDLSEERRREKYDAIVAAIDITPFQQERYLELAEAYTSFVQQARQHKTAALEVIAQSAVDGKPASSSLGRMAARYLEAIQGASMLTAYRDAEVVACVELMNGMGKITKPLQKARATAMAYPHFIDLLQVMEAIKRLPPPSHRLR